MADVRREWVRAAVAVAFLAVLILLLAPPGGRVPLDQRLTTLRTSPDGAGALYELLPALGVAVDRRMTPLDGPAPLGAALAILQPTEPLTGSEVDTVMAWIEDGGRLIAAAPFGPVAERLGVDADFRAPGSSPPQRPLHGPWTEGMDSVGSVRLVLEVGEDSPLTDIEPLVADADTTGIVVLRARLGQGRVVLFSDPSLLTNRRIADAGAAVLFVRAAAAAVGSDGALVFDEYHHGHRGATPTQAFFGFLASTRPGWLLLQLAAVALLALLPAAIRFGAPVPAGAAARRSPLEHVAALGEVYRQARAADLARRRLLVGFARRLGRERPPPGGEGAFIERIARGAPAGDEAVRAVGRAWEGGLPVRELAQRIDDAINRLNRTT